MLNSFTVSFKIYSNKTNYRFKLSKRMNTNNADTVFCATVLYPFLDNTSFDFDHYVNVLIPEYVKLLGDNCVRYEVRKGLTSPGANHIQFICIANFWIRSGEQFGAAMAKPEMKEIMQKIAAFTDIQPIRQFDEVLISVIRSQTT